MRPRLLMAVALLACAACAAPPLQSRVVDHGPLWLVRLDASRDPAQTARQFNHPMDVSDPELMVILEHVFIEGPATGTPPRPVFSYGELTCIVPGIREALHRATASEWVVFSVMDPKATHQTLTSGGLFVKDAKLYLLLANHRLQVPAGKTDVVDPLTAIPLHVQGQNPDSAALIFSPPRFMGHPDPDVLPTRSEPVRRIVVDYDALRAERDKWTTLLPPVLGERQTVRMATGC